MTKHGDPALLDDDEFAQLFASMDNITASDELKASTLDAIFSQMEAEETTRYEEHLSAQETKGEQKQRPFLSLVTDATPQGDEDTSVTAAAHATTTKAKHTKRDAKWKVRIAAALVAIALGVGSGIAYALPVSHVLVSVDDTTFDLGVNLFGTTVSATANNDAGKSAIASTEVHNVGYRDAMNRLLDKFEQDHKDETGSVSVRVNDRFGNRNDRFSEEANQVLENRGQPGGRVDVQPMPTSDGEGAPVDDINPQQSTSSSNKGDREWMQPQHEEQLQAPQGELGGSDPQEFARPQGEQDGQYEQD